MADRKDGGWRYYSQGGSWKIHGVSKVVAVVSVSYRDGRQVRGGVTRVAPLLFAPLIALPRGTRFINFFLFLFLFFLFFSTLPPHARARFSSAQPAARRVTGGGPPRHWLKAWKTGHPRRAIGQGSPLSSSCQSGAWLNLWMIKRWMVSARVVKSPRFEPRSWSFPRFILFTWHVTWRLFHEASRRKLHTIRWISRSST